MTKSERVDFSVNNGKLCLCQSADNRSSSADIVDKNRRVLAGIEYNQPRVIGVSSNWLSPSMIKITRPGALANQSPNSAIMAFAVPGISSAI